MLYEICGSQNQFGVVRLSGNDDIPAVKKYVIRKRKNGYACVFESFVDFMFVYYVVLYNCYRIKDETEDLY